MDRLHFDPQNPRLPSSVRGKSDPVILKWMLEDATLLELIGSIAADGYFPGEPLLVAPRRETAPEVVLHGTAQLVVVEGNRRLAAVRLLHDPAKATSRRRAVEALLKGAKHSPPTQLPVIAFRRRTDVLDHLGFRHVTGIKAWTPLAKANYVNQLIKRARERHEDLGLDELAQLIGSKPWYVGRLLAVRAIVDRLKRDKAFMKQLGLEEDELPFSLMLVALSRTNIVEYIGLQNANSPALPGLDTKRLKQVARWLFQKRKDGRTALGESRNMTFLAQVVTSDAAIQALEEGTNIRDAAVLALDPDELLRVALADATRSVDLALRQRSRLKSGDASIAAAVAALSKKVETLESLVSPAKSAGR